MNMFAYNFNRVYLETIFTSGPFSHFIDCVTQILFFQSKRAWVKGGGTRCYDQSAAETHDGSLRQRGFSQEQLEPGGTW